MGLTRLLRDVGHQMPGDSAIMGNSRELGTSHSRGLPGGRECRNGNASSSAVPVRHGFVEAVPKCHIPHSLPCREECHGKPKNARRKPASHRIDGLCPQCLR